MLHDPSSTDKDAPRSKSAIISPDGLYRYDLWRSWDGYDGGPACVFIGLNPSTADATLDDPTIRRCVGFAKREGFGRMAMLNLFAFRATDPKQLLTAKDPIGPENDKHLTSAMASSLIIAAWGVHGTLHMRDFHVKELAKRCGAHLMCLGTTKAGHPKHPLYLPADALLQPFEVPND